MAKIDTSGWKEFRVGYLVNNNKKIGTGLFKIVNSVPYHSQDVVENDDGINYVTRSKFNNGVKCKVEKCDNFIINPSGTISFGAENANFFYQHEEYITGNKMYYLDTSDLSKYSALFLQSVLEATFTNNFSFSDGLIPSKIYDEFIKLPVDTNGNPDWEYMEEYMTEVMRESEESIENLKQVSQEKKKVDITEWKDFRVGDLFDVQTTKSLDKLQLEFSDDYEYDFVGRSYVNNGIQGHLKKQSFEPNPSNTFSVVQIGEQVCLYRENEWYASQNIFILKPKYKKVKETSFFMSCIITKTIKIKFGDNAYASYPTKNSLIDTAIPLPIDSDGNPDWEYMEEYMSAIMKESNIFLEGLMEVCIN